MTCLLRVVHVVLPCVVCSCDKLVCSCATRGVAICVLRVVQVVTRVPLCALLLLVLFMVCSCVTGGVTFCGDDMCTESSTDGDQSSSLCSHVACPSHGVFMCYRWCYLLWW